jgi:hypothetical protein
VVTPLLEKYHLRLFSFHIYYSEKTGLLRLFQIVWCIQLQFKSLFDMAELRNYVRLLSLVSEEGTRQIEQYVLNNVPDTLENTLKKHRSKLKKIISRGQFRQIYSENDTGEGTCKQFDIYIYGMY